MKKTIIYFIILTLLSSTFVFSQKIEKAFNYINKNKHKKAVEIFRKSISKKKNIIIAKFGLAQIYSDKNYKKNNIRKAYGYIRYVERKYKKLSSKKQQQYEDKYKLNKSSITELKNRVSKIAFNIVKSKNSVKEYNIFIYEFANSKHSAIAEIRRDSLLYYKIKKDNILEDYKYYVKKFPNSKYYKRAKKTYELLWKKIYKEYSEAGEISLITEFNQKYPDYPFYNQDTKNDRDLAIRAQQLKLYKKYNPKQKVLFEKYIKNAAPKELAFVALQRILEPAIYNKEWNEATQILEQYKPLFPNKNKQINKLIEYFNKETQALNTERLGNVINTDKHEYAPVLTANSKAMYFCGRKRSDNIGGEDIFVSRYKNNSWTKPFLLKVVNTAYAHEAPLCISADGRRMLVYSNMDIYYSDKLITGWTSIKKHPVINSDEWDADAVITADGKAIFFISDRKGSIGKHRQFGSNYHGSNMGNLDIYVSTKTETGWSKPINIGKTINTPYGERSPFLHPDMKTLYFSSDGHGGFGRLDVYKTTRLNDSSWTEWSEPINLGKDINTPKDEYDYKITTDGKKAIFSSFTNNNLDIYTTELPKEYRPDMVVTISGKIFNENKKPIEATIKWEDLITGKNMGYLRSDPLTGEYIIVLTVGKKYGYFIDRNGYYPTSGNIDLTNIKESQNKIKDITITSYKHIIENKISIPLKNIFFDTNKYLLKPESYHELARLAKFIKSNPTLLIEISGHTDNKGTITKNITLSQNRANSVKNYLIKIACKSKNLKALGYGQSKPIETNNSKEGRAKNRRVEFKVLKK